MYIGQLLSKPLSRIFLSAAIFQAAENIDTAANTTQAQTSTSQTQKEDLDGKMKDPRFTEFVRVQHRKAKALSEKYNPELKEIVQDPGVEIRWLVTPDVPRFVRSLIKQSKNLKNNDYIEKYLEKHSSSDTDERETHAITLGFAFKDPNTSDIAKIMFITVFKESLFETSFEEVLAVRIHEDLHIIKQYKDQIPRLLKGENVIDEFNAAEIEIYIEEISKLNQIRKNEGGIDQHAMSSVIIKHEAEIKRLKLKQNGDSYLPILVVGGTTLLVTSVLLAKRRLFAKRH